MNGKTFSNISKEECLYVYKDILDNSDDLWLTGEILAREEKFGRAISISIASIEELVKSIIFLYDFNGFEFRRVKGINALLKNHEMRHAIAYLLYIGGGFIVELQRLGEKAIANHEEMINFLEEGRRDIEKTYKKIKRHFLKKFVQLRKEAKWFSDADMFRQKGFYSDYDGELKVPTKITKDEFNDTIKRLEVARIMGKTLIKSIENKPESLNKFLAECKTNNYYKYIGKVLNLVNKRKKRPFELFEENFEEF